MNTIFSNNLKKFRLQKNLTQEQVAEFLHVNAQTVSRWECNTTLPDVTMLPELARLYCVTVDDFFKETSSVYENYAQRLASVYEKTRNPEDFIRADVEFQKLKNSGSYSPEDRRVHGVIHQSMMGYCKDFAFASYDAIIDLLGMDNVAPENKTYWLTRQHKLYLHVQTGKAEGAINDQLAQIQKYPNNYMEWATLLYAYFYAKQYAEGYAYLLKAIAKFPDKWELYAIGSDICRLSDRYDEALQYCDKTLSLTPDNLDAKYAKAFCHEKMGQWQKAYAIWCEIAAHLKKNGCNIEAATEEKRAKRCLEKLNG